MSMCWFFVKVASVASFATWFAAKSWVMAILFGDCITVTVLVSMWSTKAVHTMGQYRQDGTSRKVIHFCRTHTSEIFKFSRFSSQWRLRDDSIGLGDHSPQ